jgi:hypothetical protein
VTGDQLSIAVQLILAGLLGRAGVRSLHDPGRAAVVLGQLGLVRRPPRPLGMLVGVVEVAIAVAVLAPSTRRAGAMAAALLSACLIALLAWRWWHGQDLQTARPWWPGLVTAGAVLVAAAPQARADLVVYLQASTIASTAVAAALLAVMRRSLATTRRQLGDDVGWEWTTRPAGAAEVAGSLPRSAPPIDPDVPGGQSGQPTRPPTRYP